MANPQPTLQTFLSLLEQTLSAPRLSGSKVTLLSEQSQTFVLRANDTSLITSFVRQFNALPPASQSRISALYVFDAIVRANVKTGGANLVRKMEGVVESFVGGMIGDGKGGVWTEGKDKTRKIIEIWTKTGTFPSSTIERLQARLVSKDASSSLTSNDPPRPVMSPVLPPLNISLPGGAQIPGLGQTIGASTTPPIAPGGLPPEIQKLLGIPPPITNSNQPFTQPQPTSAPIDIAALLATVTKSQVPPPPQQYTIPHAQPQPAAILPGGIAIDPAQLAALARLANLPQQQQTAILQHHQPIPPPNQLPIPGPRGVLPPLHFTLPTSQPGPSVGGYDGRQIPSYDSQPGMPYTGNGGGGGYPEMNSRPPYDQSSSHGPPRRDSRDRDRENRYGDGGGRNQGWNGNGSGNGEREFNRRRSRSPEQRGGDEGRRGRGRGGRNGGGGGGRGRDEKERFEDKVGPLGAPSRWGQPRGEGQRGFGGSQSQSDAGGGGGSKSGDVGGGKGHSAKYGQVKPVGGGDGGGSGRAALPVQPGKDEFGRDLPIGEQGGPGGEEEDMALDAAPDDEVDTKPYPPVSNQIDAQPQIKTQNQSAGSSASYNNPQRTFSPTPNTHQKLHSPTTNFSPSNNLSFQSQQNQPRQQYQQNQQSQQSQQPQQPRNPSFSNQQAGPTLANFELASFDPTNPEAWAMLAVAWKGSTGREPNQIELMQFLASGEVPSGGGGGGGGGGMGGSMGMNGMGMMGDGGGYGGQEESGYNGNFGR